AEVRFFTASRATAAPPVLDEVVPAHGLEAGGETVVLHGENFLPGATVRIGDKPAFVGTNGVAADGRSITVVVPSGQVGAAAVTVENPDKLSVMRLGAYRYLPAPQIASVTPAFAPTMSQQLVTLRGTGLFVGSQVKFGGVPALSTSVDSTGALVVKVPDHVVGAVDVSVTTPGASAPVSHVLSKGFTFTLQRRQQLPLTADVFAWVGRTLLAARNGKLIALDPSSSSSPVEVTGVTNPSGLVVAGRTAILAGQGEVVRYALGTCGSAPGAACAPTEMDRVPLVTSTTRLSSLAANERSAYVAVADGGELALLGNVEGKLEVVSRTTVAPGHVVALDFAGDMLAVLVQNSSYVRVELRSLQDGALTLLGVADGMSYPARGLATSGTRVAVAAGYGLRLLDVTDPALPAVLGNWNPPTGSMSTAVPTSVSFVGPWVLAAGYDRATWFDTTHGLVARTFMTYPAMYYGGQALIGDGVAAIGSSSGTYLFDTLPYPSVAAASPLPGGLLAAGEPVSVTLPSEDPTSRVAATGVKVFDGAAEVTGSRTLLGSTVRFTPSSLTQGRPYTVQVTFPAKDFVGGNLLAPWSFPIGATGVTREAVVSTVTPAAGSTAGGYTVELVGQGFDAQTKVYLGANLAPDTRTPTATSLSVTAPASLSAGPVRVRVVTGRGETVDVPGGFVYVAPLTLAGVTPGKVDFDGGWVRVIGSGFTRGLRVAFDGVNANLRNITATSVEAQVPAGLVAGPVVVALTQPGSAPVASADLLTRGDGKPPSVVAWEPIEVASYGTVPRNAVLTVRFNEGIDAATAGGVKLWNTSNGTLVAGTTSLVASGTGVAFTPQAVLPSSTSLLLEVVGVKDVSGNEMSKAVRYFSSQDDVAPSVSLALANSSESLLQGTRLAAGVQIAFNVTGTDDSRYIQSISFSVDDKPVAKSVDGFYKYTWADGTQGTTSMLLATVRDRSGNEAQTRVLVEITADPAPSVSFLKPTVATLNVEEGTTLDVQAQASDNHAVRSLELRLDGVPVRKSSGLNVTATALSHALRLNGVGATTELHRLTAVATDSQGQVTTSAIVNLNVGPDVTRPVVTWNSPVAGMRLVSGTPTALNVSVADSNTLSFTSFSVDGTVVASSDGPPRTVSWTAPVVTTTRTVTLEAVVRDARGNEGEATALVTVEPAPAEPIVSFLEPEADAWYSTTEGRPLRVSVRALSPRGISRVRLSLEGTEVVLTRQPYTHTFTVPPMTSATGVLTVKAVAVDASGKESKPTFLTVKVVDDGKPAPNVTVASVPAGPLFLGGSTVAVSASTDAGVPLLTTLKVGDAVLPSVPGNADTYGLPLGDEGMPVIASASASAGGLLGTSNVVGTLSVFARAPADVVPSEPHLEGTVQTAVQDGQWALLRDDGSGRGTLELRSADDLSLMGSRMLSGRAAGVAFTQDRVAVALRDLGTDRLELLSLPSLVSMQSLPLRQQPHALVAVRGGLAVGTREGLELRRADGALAARMALGSVSALAADGERLLVLSERGLQAVDVSRLHAPRVVATTAAGGATKLAALRGNQVCAVGTVIRCYRVQSGAFTVLGEAAPGAVPQSVSALGPWLLVGTADGLRVFDARSAPVSAGLFPAVPGVVVAEGGNILAAAPRGLSRLKLMRGEPAPVVSLSAPASATAGSRLSLTASVEDGTDPLDSYTAELLVDGRVVEVLDSRVPTAVDLPLSGSTATLVLRVRDQAGHVEEDTAEVALNPASAGPALAALELPLEVLEGTRFQAVPVPVDPARVAEVEVKVLETGGASVRSIAPELAATLVAPSAEGALVSRTVTVRAVAYDAQGRAGEPVTALLTVKPDATPSGPVVSLARVGEGDILEGGLVTVAATLTPDAPGAEVRFVVDGVEQQVRVGAPYQATLRMPVSVGARVVPVKAFAVDAYGRTLAPSAELNLFVKDDLLAPGIHLTVEPSDTLVAAGSRLTARAVATDTVGVGHVELQLFHGTELLASGGTALTYEVPVGTASGTLLQVVATATDGAGNRTTVSTQRRVVAPASPVQVAQVGGIFVGARHLALLGELVVATTSSGLAVGKLTRGPVPAVEPVGAVALSGDPTGLSLRGPYAVVGLGKAGVDVVKLSATAQPELVGHVDVEASSVVGDSSLFAYSATSSYLWSLRLDDPTAPNVSSLGWLGGTPRLLTGCDNGYMLASPGAVSCAFTDETGTGRTVTASFTGNAVAAEHEGNILFVVTSRSLLAFGPSGSHMTKLSELVLPSDIRAMTVAAGQAYVQTADGLLRLVDVHDPRKPRVVAVDSLDARSLTLSGGVLVAAGARGLTLKVPPVPPVALEPEALGTYVASDLPRGLAVYGRGVLMAAGSDGVTQVSLDDPALPERVRQMTVGGNLRQVERLGLEVFTLDG
ncbi:MAG TPA: IPT/TIG domain-containing protein, partial [Archangium sp.]|nr:IPT/TIG domain-containing protein [Archangium sp.]